jgi:ribosome-associated protein
LETGVRTRRGRKRSIPIGVDPRELARQLARAAAEKQASEIVILDLRGLTAACDFFVLATALSEPHVAALAEHLEQTLAERGVRPWHVEGRRNRRWVLLDFVDVVVHLFLPETREYYRLENLWAEAPRESIDPVGPKATDTESGGAHSRGEE